MQNYDGIYAESRWPRLNWERNRSTIKIYDFRRIAVEFGLTSAF